MYPVHKGWKAVNSSRLYELYIEVMTHAKAIGYWKLAAFPPLYTRKTVRAFGSCFDKKINGVTEIAIVMNEMLLAFSDDQIREVIVHEVAHAVCIGHHHDAVWKRTANAIGKKWGYKIERQCQDRELNDAIYKLKEKRSPHKYELYCPVCGKTYKYSRMCQAVRHPEKYWCAKDKVSLRSRAVNKN